MNQPTLTTLPPELLHLIALFAAQPDPDSIQGPPTSLPALLLTCCTIYDTLSVSSNPTLYAEIFKQRFDFNADRVRRRCKGPSGDAGAVEVSPHMLAVELKTRFESLKRLRYCVGCLRGTEHDEYRERDLWAAVFMMMENEGKNISQLMNYTLIWRWLHHFFILGDASGARDDLLDNKWPRGDCEMMGDCRTVNGLALWLLWLCGMHSLDDNAMTIDFPTKHSGMFSLDYRAFTIDFPTIISTYAIAGNKYPIAPYWSSFCLSDHPESTPPASVLYYNSQVYPRPPPIAMPAILIFISKRASESLDLIGPNLKTVPGHPELWDLDWDRWILGQPETDKGGDLMRYYHPGMLDGTWEGLFTYTDFETYSDLLSNGSPDHLRDAEVRHNLQVWKLKEYFLPPVADAIGSDTTDILPFGSALDGWLPVTVPILTFNDSQIVFGLNGKSLRYIRATGAEVNQKARDVLLFGTGHSSWGDFILCGRIRRDDAFVHITKQYLDNDARAKWLYRGYIIGGRLVGRWRDCITRSDLDGYEGAFAMGRRGE